MELGRKDAGCFHSISRHHGLKMQFPHFRVPKYCSVWVLDFAVRNGGCRGCFGGAGGGLLFNILYDCLKELISKSRIYKPLLKNILFMLDSFGEPIKQIEVCNEELGLPKEEVKKFKSHMKEGIEVVKKCSKVRKWNIYKKYKYANRLLGWNDSLQRHLDILKVQEIRDAKRTLVSVNKIERVVTGIESNSIILEAGGRPHCNYQ
ncbi:hypothetical protein M0R45_001441 [Rubus argutus]|uniref:RPW8 domain-containing protein n=1 Tax=Rubus argutus TaxID=59490 RepID=A0AAW1VL51_RUBAR